MLSYYNTIHDIQQEQPKPVTIGQWSGVHHKKVTTNNIRVIFCTYLWLLWPTLQGQKLTGAQSPMVPRSWSGLLNFYL